MNCNNTRENLIELLAQESAPDGHDGQAEPSLTAHVSQCPSCTQELESLRKTMALMDAWEAPEPSPYFLTRLRAHVKEEREKAPAKASWFAWLRRPILALSLTVVLAAGGVFYRLKFVTPLPDSPLADVEALDKNHDVIVATDLVDELSGGPSDDVSD